MTRVRVVGHDHVVLIVADVERSLAWYRDRLGLVAEREAEWRAGEAPFLSMRVNETTVIDLIEGDRNGRNVEHLALRVADDVDLQDVVQSGDFEVLDGPMWIWGAGGYGWGVYVADPDGNTVELKQYGGEPPH